MYSNWWEFNWFCHYNVIILDFNKDCHHYLILLENYAYIKSYLDNNGFFKRSFVYVIYITLWGSDYCCNSFFRKVPVSLFTRWCNFLFVYFLNYELKIYLILSVNGKKANLIEFNLSESYLLIFFYSSN